MENQYEHSLDIKARPAAKNMNFGEWRERVMQQKKGWIMIGKEVEKHSILKVLPMEN